MSCLENEPNRNPGGLRFSLVLFICLFASPSFAFQTYLDNFNTTYSTQGTRLDTCGVCHNNFSGGGPRTPYGEDYRNNNYDAAAIGALDSDGDGTSNADEASAANLTHPGFSCANIGDALNAPADLANYVSTTSPGCLGTGSPPVANANGPYVTVSGSAVNFSSAGSSDPDGQIVSYLWNFGSGYGTSTEPNPSFTYTSVYQVRIVVSLTVTDNDGNSTTVATDVHVLLEPNQPPTANAGGAVAGVAKTPVQFNGTGSSDPENMRLSYQWDFGDGNFSVLPAPMYAFEKCGVYDVKLTVVDDIGLSATDTTTATISSTGSDAPTANAGGGAGQHYDGSAGSPVQFDGAASMDSDCTIASYSWDFGDGGAAGMGVNPTHVYSTPGDYVATLTVTDNDGLTHSHSVTVTITAAGSLDGAALYANHCASCHGTGANSTKAGATVARINAGIANVPSMNSLSNLSTGEVTAIANYLSSVANPPTTPPTTPPPTTPPTADGAALYAANCEGCHGAGANTTKAGATVARINAGIANVPSMSGLSSLSAAEVQGIADYLATVGTPPTTPPTTPPPTTPPTADGAALYATNCEGCHGAGANSTKAGATVARINAGIANVPSMSGLSSLSAAEVQGIADYLATVGTPPTTPPTTPPPTTPPPTVDGAALYATNCEGCHGAGANSTKAGATVARINAGIANVPSMSGLSSLSAAEVQGIADYLATVGTPPTTPPTTPPPTDTSLGATLYADNCAACHGPGDSSAKAGATVDRINNGIAAIPSMSGLANTLSATDIQAIADYLGGSAAPTTPEGLYLSYCASCHGVDGSGGSTGEDVQGDSAGSVREAIREEREMQFLSFLTFEEIAAIASHLKALENGYTPTPPGTSPPGTGSGNGSALYDTHCASCHGPGSSSTKLGASVARIDAGIANVPAMSSLSSLSAADIQAIADFLSGANGGTATPTTDEGLYISYCASCHGADGLGGSSGESVLGDSASAIEEAIQSEPQMQSLSFLSAVQVNAIANYLAALENGDPTPTPVPGSGTGSGSTGSGTGGNGAALYDANCAACHGPGTSSAKAGASVARINAGITNVASMNSLSSLSAADIQAIADFLNGGDGGTVSPPTTREGLYIAYCSSCHGVDARGGSSGEGVRGESSSGIREAIAEEPEMRSLSFLTRGQLRSIASYLRDLEEGNVQPVSVPSGTGTTTPGTTTPPATGNGSNTDTGSGTGTGTAVDGAALYARDCAACHGPGDNSAKAGATITRINAGIANVPAMSSLSSLSAAEVRAIADFLMGNTGVTTTPPTTTTPPETSTPPTTTTPPATSTPSAGSDGAALYDSHCASCHGPGNSSTKAGANATRINAGIANVPAMSALSNLSAADIQAIADFLSGNGGTASTPPATTPPPVNPPTTPSTGSDGAALYDALCSSCHGPGSTSTKAGASASSISGAIAGIPSMASLSNLSSAEIQQIADFLAANTSGTSTPPANTNTGGTDGAALYASNCAGCHGAGNASTKAGATVARINAGIASVPTMSSLASLSTAEVQAIADYLSSTTAVVPTTPEGLYVSYCGACHGADGSGGTTRENVKGTSASSILEAIKEESEMRYLSFLTSSELRSIANFLGGGSSTDEDDRREDSDREHDD